VTIPLFWPGTAGAPVVIPNTPTLEILIGRSGWLLGVPGKSELGVTTQLGIASYDNVASRAVRVATRRGSDHELIRIEAGVATVDLMNQDGALTPMNTASVLYPDVRPMIPFIIRATFFAVTYYLFSGFVESWPATWDGAYRQGMDLVRGHAVDAMKVLRIAEVTLDRGQELSGARINAVLDAIGWPSALRAIDQGQSQVQAVTLEDANVLQHIQDVAASESGQFFIAADGTATFFDRYHITLQDEGDVWGDDTGEKRYASLTASFDDQTIYNQVTVTAPDLADQRASDTASISLFSGPANEAPRPLPISTLLTTEAEMLERAAHLVTKYAFPEQRITSLTQDNANLDPTQWPRALNKDLHDRIVARKTPAGDPIEQPSFIEGIAWEIEGGRWRLTWALSSTTLQQGQWQLGVPGRSELGVTTSLVG